MTTPAPYQLIRRPLVLSLTQRSKSALQLDEKNGLFPPCISIGSRAKAYIKEEIDAVILARVQGKTPDQIKALVQELIQQRTMA